MVYHARAPDSVGSEVLGRTMWLSEVTFDGRKVSVTPPRTQLPTGLGPASDHAAGPSRLGRGEHLPRVGADLQRLDFVGPQRRRAGHL